MPALRLGVGAKKERNTLLSEMRTGRDLVREASHVCDATCVLETTLPPGVQDNVADVSKVVQNVVIEDPHQLGTSLGLGCRKGTQHTAL